MSKKRKRSIRKAHSKEYRLPGTAFQGESSHREINTGFRSKEATLLLSEGYLLFEIVRSNAAESRNQFLRIRIVADADSYGYRYFWMRT